MGDLKRRITVLAGILALSLPAVSFAFDLGDVLKSVDINKVIDIGKSTQKAFSDFNEEEQYYIGRSAGARILTDYRYYDRKTLQKYVSSIGQTVAMASDRPETYKGYHFIVLDEPDRVNAFAVPSGFIFITTGLIYKARNEDQLAGILAHEVAHIVYYHPSNSIKQVYRDKLKKQLVGFAADQVAAENEELAGLVEGLNELSGMLIDNAAKGYSREKEESADIMAVEIMTRVGYDPRELAEILKKLNPVGSGNSGTHGNPAKRAGTVLKTAAKFKNIPENKEVRVKRFASNAGAK